MSKRFCTSCGAELDNENFCTNCGAKIEKAEINHSVRETIKSTQPPINKLHNIMFWIGFVALAIVAFIYVKNCFAYAGSFMDFVDMYDASFLYVLLYYLIGIWGVIGVAVVFFRRSSKKRYAAGATQVIILAIITIVMPIMKSALEDSVLNSITNLLLYRTGLSYEIVLSKAIFFEIVAFIAFILAKKIDISSSN